MYILLEGFHIDKQGTKVDDMAANVEIEEFVKSVHLLVGKNANKVLKKYANMLCQGYVARFPGCVFETLKRPQGKEILPQKWIDLVELGRQER